MPSIWVTFHLKAFMPIIFLLPALGKRPSLNKAKNWSNSKVNLKFAHKIYFVQKYKLSPRLKFNC